MNQRMERIRFNTVTTMHPSMHPYHSTSTPTSSMRAKGAGHSVTHGVAHRGTEPIETATKHIRSDPTTTTTTQPTTSSPTVCRHPTHPTVRTIPTTDTNPSAQGINVGAET